MLAVGNKLFLQSISKKMYYANMWLKRDRWKDWNHLRSNFRLTRKDRIWYHVDNTTHILLSFNGWCSWNIGLKQNRHIYYYTDSRVLILIPWNVSQNKTSQKTTPSLRQLYWPHRQECIPVGCVPSAAVAVPPGGICLSAYLYTPQTRHTPHPEQTPWTRHPPKGTDPRPPGPGTPPVDKHTPVKT